jgi:hypothetical protein
MAVTEIPSAKVASQSTEKKPKVRNGLVQARYSANRVGI